jgi:hypothetical protein
MRATLSIVLVTTVMATVTGSTSCSNPQQVTEDKFANLYAQALCTSLQHCCAENAVSFDYNACGKGWVAAVNNVLHGANATGNYNAQLATQCIAEVNAAAGGSCQPVPGSISDARGTCQGIFAGTLPTGAPCTSPAQCAAIPGMTVTCAVVPSDAGTSMGGGQLPLADPSVSIQGATITPQDVAVCVALPPTMPSPTACTPGPGDLCIAMNSFCDPASHACAPFNAMGAGCDPAFIASCLPGNFCTDMGGGMGVCVAAGPVGSPCTDPAMCDAMSFCDVTGSKTCVPIGMPGTPCTSNTQCSIGVCDSTTHRCLKNAIATTAACNGIVSP